MSTMGGERSALLVHAAAVAVAFALITIDRAPSLHGRADDPDAATRAALAAHVEAVAAQEHSLGTAGHDRVRDYIVTTLRQLGLAPEVQQATVWSDVGSFVRIADVQNIVVSIAGQRAGGKALLVATHYDAFAYSRGAADAGASVAVLLELARRLRRERPQNPVVLLFSDGEEWGMLGARAFVEQHALTARCAAVINLDARGSGGRPFAFELAGSSSRLVSLLARSGAPVGALSYLPDAYRRMHNDTDFNVFRAAGMSGYNVAFFDDPSVYHTALDRPERLDPATLALQFRAASTLTRTLASADLSALGNGGAATFASSPLGLLRYPRAWSWPLAAVAAVVGLLVAIALGRGRRGARALARGAAVALGSTIGAVAVTRLFVEVATHGMNRALIRWEALDASCAATVAATALTTAALLRLLRGRLDRADVAAGALVVAALASFGVALWLPEAAFILPCFVVAGAAWVTFERTRARAASRVAALAVYALALVAGLFFVGQMVAVVAAALGFGAITLVSVLVAFAALWAFVPVVEIVPGGARPAIALTALACVPLVLARVQARFDLHDPMRSSLVLVADRSGNWAAWAGLGDPLDDWTRHALGDSRRRDLGDFFGGARSPAMVAPAPLPSLSGPEVRKLSADGASFELALRAEPGSFALRCDLFTDAEVRQVEVNGIRIAARRRDLAVGQAPLTFVYFNPPRDEIRVKVALSDRRRVSASVVDARFGLPAGAPARPPYVVPDSDALSDVTFVRRSLDL